jgi:hypothetical protein
MRRLILFTIETYRAIGTLVPPYSALVALLVHAVTCIRQCILVYSAWKMKCVFRVCVGIKTRTGIVPLFAAEEAWFRQLFVDAVTRVVPYSSAVPAGHLHVVTALFCHSIASALRN